MQNKKLILGVIISTIMGSSAFAGSCVIYARGKAPHDIFSRRVFLAQSIFETEASCKDLVGAYYSQIGQTLSHFTDTRGNEGTNFKVTGLEYDFGGASTSK